MRQRTTTATLLRFIKPVEVLVVVSVVLEGEQQEEEEVQPEERLQEWRRCAISSLSCSDSDLRDLRLT